MAEVLEIAEQEQEQEPLVVHTRPVLDMNDEQFFQFCRLNDDLRIERTAEGDLIIMAPAGGSTGRGNAKLTRLFDLWSERNGTGQIFDSATGFTLPNRAMRSPDVSWVRNERLDALTQKQWERFLPLCPDFVLELRSPSDSLPALKRKMDEYIANGAQLGWLIDPIRKQVHVYRPGQPVTLLDNPATISGEPVLPGFVLNLPQIWDAMERKPRRLPRK